MKHLKKVLIVTSLSIAPLHASTSYIAIRPQAVAAARELVGWQSLINHYDSCQCYAALSLTTEYSHSFDSAPIIECLFNPDALCNGDDSARIAISGSLSPIQQTPPEDSPFLASNANREIHEWLADYFGLPRDYASTISFNPSLSNFTTDLNCYVGLDCWAQGLFFRIHAPLSYVQWELHAQEYRRTKGILGYDTGYFGPESYSVEQLLDNALSFFEGTDTPKLPDITFNRLTMARFPQDCDDMSSVGLADIEMACGWNFIRSRNYHLGLEIRASAPTGNKPCAQYILSPVVGSGGYWKLGGGITAHGIMWQSLDDCQTFGFYLDANVQHLFTTCQERVFDLLCKPNSRYMLAQKLEPNTHGLGYAPEEEEPKVSLWQFANEYAPVANLTAQPVNVSIAVEGNLVADFVYVNQNLQWELGYELWARSCEKICPCSNSCSSCSSGIWALKGDAYVYGFAADTWYPLAASEQKATIHAGTNFAPDTPLTKTNEDAAWYNPHIDNPQPASIGIPADIHPLLGGPALEQTRTSIEPLIITTNAIDYQGAATSSTSHKIFTHLSYTWHEKRRCTPFVGIGAFAEFATINLGQNCAQTSCFPGCTMGTTVGCYTKPTEKSCACTCCCPECGINQWGLWAKGGIAF